jgi:uncharacterized protein (TIGR03032 family)
MDQETPRPGSTPQPPLELTCSRMFTGWLEQQQLSLAFTTYQAGKLFLIGRRSDNQLAGFERTFPRCMGLWSDGQTLWLSSLYQLWRLENTLLPGQTDGEFDRLYVPQVGYTTGDIDVHDVAVDAAGQVVFVNTLFGCLATVSERYSFKPLWRPPFLSKLAPEDRCHLNGIALAQGEPRYATLCGESDVVEGWRQQRTGGGCVIDVKSGATVCAGLSMPHSPRVIDGQLWLLDSGTGFLGRVDRGSGTFEPVTFCPGYARGLAVVGKYALVGLSRCRQERTFTGLPLEKNLEQRKGEAMCGVLVIDWQTGDIVHWLRVEGLIEELYDVVALPGVRRPKALGFKTDEIRHVVWLESDGQTERYVAAERPK